MPIGLGEYAPFIERSDPGGATRNVLAANEQVAQQRRDAEARRSARAREGLEGSRQAETKRSAMERESFSRKLEGTRQEEALRAGRLEALDGITVAAESGDLGKADSIAALWDMDWRSVSPEDFHRERADLRAQVAQDEAALVSSEAGVRAGEIAAEAQAQAEAVEAQGAAEVAEWSADPEESQAAAQEQATAVRSDKDLIVDELGWAGPNPLTAAEVAAPVGEAEAADLDAFLGGQAAGGRAELAAVPQMAPSLIAMMQGLPQGDLPPAPPPAPVAPAGLPPQAAPQFSPVNAMMGMPPQGPVMQPQMAPQQVPQQMAPQVQGPTPMDQAMGAPGRFQLNMDPMAARQMRIERGTKNLQAAYTQVMQRLPPQEQEMYQGFINSIPAFMAASGGDEKKAMEMMASKEGQKYILDRALKREQMKSAEKRARIIAKTKAKTGDQGLYEKGRSNVEQKTKSLGIEKLRDQGNKLESSMEAFMSDDPKAHAMAFAEMAGEAMSGVLSDKDLKLLGGKKSLLERTEDQWIEWFSGRESQRNISQYRGIVRRALKKNATAQDKAKRTMERGAKAARNQAGERGDAWDSAMYELYGEDAVPISEEEASSRPRRRAPTTTSSSSSSSSSLLEKYGVR